MSLANPVDEGLIHAWIEGQLSPDEAARVERLVATDAEWGDAVAEARGLIAGASRVLRALDDVPRVGRDGTSGASSTSGTRSTRNTSGTRSRQWSRSPWLRAAAGIALVAGVSSVLWTRTDVFDALDVSPVADSAAPQVRADERPQAPTTRDAAAPQPARPTEATPTREQREASADAARPSESKRRDSATRSVASPPAAAPIPAKVPVVEQGVVGANTVVARGDSNAGAVGTGAGVGSGTGTRAVGVAANAATGVVASADRNAGALELAAKSAVSANVVDSRLAGCWLLLSTPERAEERERRADAADAIVPLVRFIAPVVTDATTLATSAPVAQRAAATRGGGRGGPPPATAALSEVAPSRRVVNATVVRAAQPDSAFTAEWMDSRGRHVLTFAVSGDTLRGTSRVSLADSAGTPFVASRVVCPR